MRTRAGGSIMFVVGESIGRKSNFQLTRRFTNAPYVGLTSKLKTFGWRGRKGRFSPHYSWVLLLQSPIHCYDKPSVGGLAPRPLTVLHEYASRPQGSARHSRNAAQRFRDELS